MKRGGRRERRTGEKKRRIGGNTGKKEKEERKNIIVIKGLKVERDKLKKAVNEVMKEVGVGIKIEKVRRVGERTRREERWWWSS